jgi:hypothetical protein
MRRILCCRCSDASYRPVMSNAGACCCWLPDDVSSWQEKAKQHAFQFAKLCAQQLPRAGTDRLRHNNNNRLLHVFSVRCMAGEPSCVRVPGQITHV